MLNAFATYHAHIYAGIIGSSLTTYTCSYMSQPTVEVQELGYVSAQVNQTQVKNGEYPTESCFSDFSHAQNHLPARVVQ